MRVDPNLDKLIFYKDHARILIKITDAYQAPQLYRLLHIKNMKHTFAPRDYSKWEV